MMALPPVLPDPACRETTRLGRDHWVRVSARDYSVHPRAIGRRVEVRVDLDEVVVTCAGEVVARHPRSLGRHRTVTDRRPHERPRPARGAPGASRAGSAEHEPDVEVRDLAVYDRATGVA